MIIKLPMNIFENLAELRCVRIQLSCEKKDAIPMKNRLFSLKHRTDKLQAKSNERLRTLTFALVSPAAN
jgi:hypothetical protein